MLKIKLLEENEVYSFKLNEDTYIIESIKEKVMYLNTEIEIIKVIINPCVCNMWRLGGWISKESRWYLKNNWELDWFDGGFWFYCGFGQRCKCRLPSQDGGRGLCGMIDWNDKGWGEGVLLYGVDWTVSTTCE